MKPGHPNKQRMNQKRAAETKTAGEASAPPAATEYDCLQINQSRDYSALAACPLLFSLLPSVR